MGLVSASQAQKHVTVNNALTRLDALVQLSVLDRGLSTPPGSPSEGDRYIVASSPTGDWTGWANRIALYTSGAWVSFTPNTGWQCFVEDEAILMYYNGSSWVNLTAVTNLSAQVAGSFGGATGIAVAEEELTLSGSSVTASGNGRFPDRAIMLGVSTRVTQVVTGVPSWGCGISGEATKFGGSLGLTLGSTNKGVIGPTAVYALTPVVLTPTSGTFSGGKVRVAIHYLHVTASTS